VMVGKISKLAFIAAAATACVFGSATVTVPSAVAQTAPAVDRAAVDMLVLQLTQAIETAARRNRPLLPAINGVIETSGAEPAVVAEALQRLIRDCPRGEILRAMTERQRRNLPAWCAGATLAGLNDLRELSLAQVSGDATGGTGATAGGGLPGATTGGAQTATTF
jgi:hypothetical protein